MSRIDRAMTRRRVIAGTAGAAGLVAAGLWAGASPARAGAVEWRLGGRRAAGFRAAGPAGAAPLVVAVHGPAGLDEATRALCLGLAGQGCYAIAPDLHWADPEATGGAALRHRLDDAHVRRTLAAAADFARREGASSSGPVFVGVGADGLSLIKSRDAGFSRIETYAAAAGRPLSWRRVASWLAA